MTNPKAKTAQEYAEDIMRTCRWLFTDEGKGLFREIIDALYSYADSVAEKRVLFERTEAGMTINWKDGYDKGFRAGQERMRERAAKQIETLAAESLMAGPMNCSSLIFEAKQIRSLEVEEK
jgi:hypothetical protein